MSADSDALNVSRIRDLAALRRRIALILTLLLIIVYFGYLAMIVFARSIVAVEVFDGVSLGIWVAASVILCALAFSIGYVAWANDSYDRDVKTLR